MDTESFRPSFTMEQECWICFVIDSWYMRWKNNICKNDKINNLGFAKEELKNNICKTE